MPCDYKTIRENNIRRYGTDIDRIGPMLLSERYDDRTHFIFELLQNAEDALGRRKNFKGSRVVSFQLAGNTLRVSHFGQPFDETDVHGLCGIAESSKNGTAIGRFGIGFKAVYAFTDRPEIHSGDEAFAIESFVWPVAIDPIKHASEETIVLIPLKNHDEPERDEIVRGLESLDASTLLFLRQIEGITWTVEDGRSGFCTRSEVELGPNIRRVSVESSDKNQQKHVEEWLIFSRQVSSSDGEKLGCVEISFSLIQDDEDRTGSARIKRLESSTLRVFFPTVLETHLGFLVQGPYRTTPSRDNVPPNDDWNRHLVNQTATLLRDCLPWLRDNGFLDVETLCSLPINPDKFGESKMFNPLYDATKMALSEEDLLPRFDQGYVSSGLARLGRTQELRELFTPTQIAQLYGEESGLVWLSGEITPGRWPELRNYLIDELKIPEITPRLVVSQLDQVTFLESQPDEWIGNLYLFLNRQQGLLNQCKELPLVRVESGRHVRPYLDGIIRVFLPSSRAKNTDFSIVRSTLCADEESLAFLKSLGLTECDAIDDVMQNVLPKYRRTEIDMEVLEYDTDIARIRTAFDTDSKAKQARLIDALKNSAFVMTVDAGTKTRQLAKPGKVYQATERLKGLFAGVDGILFVDDELQCLRGKAIRRVLEACGISRFLRASRINCRRSSKELTEIRREHGLKSMTWSTIQDKTLHGLDSVLMLLPNLDATEGQKRAELLWNALADIASRRGQQPFIIEYMWRYSHQEVTATIDADFVSRLQETAWVPDSDGNLLRPEMVDFETLSWEANPVLLSKIQFRPPILDHLWNIKPNIST